jgi:hypothetical protein
MATDHQAILDNLLHFYPFGAKVVLAVGAGGGQLAGYGRAARSVIAVDNDATALASLRDRIATLGLEERFVLLKADFAEVEEHADVVLFEFALHEIADPGVALAHAAGLAPDVVIIDHAPGSPWAHVVDETEKVAAAWEAIEARGARRTQRYDAVQRFATYEELFEKVKGQGAEAIRRIERWRGCSEITIPMAYATALT